jgi:hypothetical protein
MEEYSLTQDTIETEENSESKVIGKINSALYGGFTKILSLLSQNMGKSDIISIKNGKLSSISGGGYLFCDLEQLFGKNNFDIIDPQYSIKLMKLINGGDEVVFIDDDEQAQYHISNLINDEPQITITLPKPDYTSGSNIGYPEIGEIQCKLDNIDADLVNTITTAEKNVDSQYFIIEIHKDEETGSYEIISIATDKETFKYNFKNIDDYESQNIEKYKLFNPFPVQKPDDIEFELYSNSNDDFWIKTTTEVGMAEIEYIEKLSKMNVFDSFSL